MRINTSKLYTASFCEAKRNNPSASANEQDKNQSNPQKKLRELYRSAAIILNPTPGTALVHYLLPDGEKQIVALKDKKIVSLCLFAKGAVIPYEVSDGIDEKTQIIKRKTFYNPDGSIDKVMHGLHYATSRIDKEIVYDRFGIPYSVATGIDVQKTTIKKRRFLYSDGTTNYIQYNVNEQKGTIAKAVYYFNDDHKKIERIQEGIIEDPKTGLLTIKKQVNYEKNGMAFSIYYDIQEQSDGPVLIGQLCSIDKDGKTVKTIYENATVSGNSLIDYEKGIEFKLEDGKLQAYSSEKPEIKYVSDDDDDDATRIIKPITLQ